MRDCYWPQAAIATQYSHGAAADSAATSPLSAGCLAEAGLASRHVRRVILVCRTYPIRVGDTNTGMTSGFMSAPITPDEIARLRAALDVRASVCSSSWPLQPGYVRVKSVASSGIRSIWRAGASSSSIRQRAADKMTSRRRRAAYARCRFPRIWCPS